MIGMKGDSIPGGEPGRGEDGHVRVEAAEVERALVAAVRPHQGDLGNGVVVQVALERHPPAVR